MMRFRKDQNYDDPVIIRKRREREEEKEWIGELVRIIVIVWSGTLLTFSYVRMPDGQRILDFDPTFVASVFSGSLAGFGIIAARNGGKGCCCKEDKGDLDAAVEEYYRRKYRK